MAKTNVKTKIEELEKIISNYIPQIKDYQELNDVSSSFRVTLVDAICGITIDRIAGGIKVKSNRALPTDEEIVKIASIAETFNKSAMDCLASLNASDGEDDEDDFEFSENIMTTVFDTENIKTMTTGKFKEILGMALEAPILTSVSILSLAAAAKKWRKYVNVRNGIIIGVAAITLVASGIIIYNKKFRDNNIDATETDTTNTSDDVIDVDVDDDDVVIVDDDADVIAEV